MSRIYTLQTPLNTLDPDGSVAKELHNIKESPVSLDTALELRSAAEMLLLDRIEADKKAAEKNYRENKEFVQVIYLASLLEECRLYLSFLRITEQNLEKIIDREMLLDRQRYEEKMQALQNRIEDIYKTQHHPIAPEQQKIELLIADAISTINDLQSRFDSVLAQREKNWGAATWEEGLKIHAKAAMDVVRKIDPLDIVSLPPEAKNETTLAAVGEFHDDLEERLAERPSFEKLRKILDTSYKAVEEERFFKPSVSDASEIPVPPVMTQIYAPTNKNIKTQFELDTEVLFAANARNLYQKTCGFFLQKDSFVNMGVKYAKEAMKPIRELYHDKIEGYMDDSIILNNLKKLKDEVNDKVNDLRNVLQNSPRNNI